MHKVSSMQNLDYLGQKTHGEVNELLARAHVFVNTSLHEGFPNTFVQAWMREVPVVSLQIDPDDVLDREAIGIHARTEDSLAQSVRLLITDPVKRAQYAARARRYAMARHSMRNAQLLARLMDITEIRSADEHRAGRVDQSRTAR
jgi:glycosyltransferase involved in cell wall biosynthesis